MANKLCLSMCTKNSADKITATLDSIVQYLGYWVILVDASTSDKTAEVIEKYFAEKKIPGKLYVEPWVSYSHNKNLAIERCDTKDNQCDYIYLTDDDDPLVGELILPDKMDKDTYLLRIKNTEEEWWRPQILHTKNKKARYVGRVHEYLNYLSGTSEKIEGSYYMSGIASPDTPEKYAKYVKLLEEDLKDDPKNSRSIFYLARTRYEHGDNAEAFRYFKMYVNLDFSLKVHDEEFLSMYQGALCLMNMGEDWNVVMEKLLQAYEFSPSRYEPIARIALHYSHRSKWQLAYRFATWGLSLQRENQRLFTSLYDYDYNLQDVAGLSAINLDKWKEALDHVTTALTRSAIPMGQRARLVGYVRIITEKLKPEAIAPLSETDIISRDEIAFDLLVEDINKDNIRSILRYTSAHIQLHMLNADGGDTKFNQFETNLVTCIEKREDCSNSPHVFIPKGYRCNQQWYPSVCVQILVDTGADVLILTDPPSSVLSNIAPMSHPVLDCVYYVVDQAVPKLEIFPYVVLSGLSMPVSKVVYLAYGIFSFSK